MEPAEKEGSPELGSPYKGFTTEAQSRAQRSSLFELTVCGPYLRTFKSITN